MGRGWRGVPVSFGVRKKRRRNPLRIIIFLKIIDKGASFGV